MCRGTGQKLNRQKVFHSSFKQKSLNMWILLLLLCVGLAHCQTCDYNVNDPTCEWKNANIDWQCPVGKELRVKAFWGRLGNTTCVDKVHFRYLQNLNCPGNDALAAQAVREWCDQNAVGGQCNIRATTKKLRINGEKLDPCVGTFKYLKACTYCVDKELCDYNVLNETCEWKYRDINWQCPAGQRPKVRAFWGRLDNTTCVDQVPYRYLQNTNCPSDDGQASQAVQLWCNQKAVGGVCNIRASTRKLKISGKKLDPCVGTFKYLKTCMKCVDMGPKTLVLLDCTGSMATRRTSYMTLLVKFLDEFFAYTSADAFWATHETNLEIIPFTTQLDTAEKVVLDYSDYASAQNFRDDDIQHINDFKDKIENKAPVSLTNLGQVMKNVKDNYDAVDVHKVLLVSDFINIQTAPDMVASATALKDDGVHVYPILLDKPENDPAAYNQVRQASMDQVGIEITNGNPIPFDTIY